MVFPYSQQDLKLLVQENSINHFFSFQALTIVLLLESLMHHHFESLIDFSDVIQGDDKILFIIGSRRTEVSKERGFDCCL